MHLEDGNEADRALNTEEAKISDGTNLMSAHLTLLTAFCASCISTRSTRRGTVCNVNATDGIPRACDGQQRQWALTKDRCVYSCFILRRNGCAWIRESLFVRDGPSQHLPDAVVDDPTLIGCCSSPYRPADILARCPSQATQGYTIASANPSLV